MKMQAKQSAASKIWLALLILAGMMLPAAGRVHTQAQEEPPPSPASAVKTAAANDVKTTPGKFIVERPTLISAGFEWMIDGDANRTAKVDVSYRKKGDADWKPALRMMRLQYEYIHEEIGPRRRATLHPAIINYTAPNAFAGSVFNLQPNTDYEFHFVLSDPDGVKGPHEKTVALKTRPEPMPATGGHVYHVYPFGYKGPKQEPSFTGLLDAYYTGAFDADYWNGYPPRVKPGDIILMHAGVYKDTAFRYYYGHTTPVNGVPLVPYGTFFDGTYYLHANGTPDKPIVIKAAGDGEVAIDGNNVAVLFDLTKANYNYFEGITVRNADIAFLLGRKAYWGADGFTLKHCKIENVARGVHEDWGLAKDYYIADNTFIGRTSADRLVGFTDNPARWGKDPAWPVPLNMNPGGSEYAVKVYGQGHVVAYNHVERFHDGIDIATYGNPDAACERCGEINPTRHTTEEDLPGSIDFYGNDVSNTNDNCFEMDGGARNIRYFRNRCFNSANSGLSIDPGFGGPFYFFQNVYYNNVSGVGGCGNSCAGMMFYQNTIISEVHGGGSNIHFLNNLIIPIGASGGAGAQDTGNGPWPSVFGVNTSTNYSTSDYNGFGTSPREKVEFQWASPPPNVMADYDFDHSTVKRDFKMLQEYSAATGQDTHSVLIDLSSFNKMTLPDRNDISKLYKPADFDFTLTAGSKAIDAGVVLPNINDGFTGKAPDLGAIEYGSTPPHYGPRE